MTIRTFGALLGGGLLILATSAGAYEPDKKDKAGAAITTSQSNIKTPPACKKAGGIWDKAKKSCSARP